MTWLLRLFTATALLAVAACSSNKGQGCDTGGGTGLASSDWPKSRKDLSNTGHIDATVSADATEQWVFPPRDQPALDAALTSPVITADGKVIIISRRSDFPTTSHLSMVDPATYPKTHLEANGFDMPLSTTVGVSPGSAPVISQTRIGILFSDGVLREFDFEGGFFGALSLNGATTASPTIDTEGTVYAGTSIGTYVSLCAGGGGRFALAVGATESTAVLIHPEPTPAPGQVADPNSVRDDFSVIGSNDGKVRAISVIGEALWTFSANAAVQASVVHDQANDLIYGVDTSGRVFAVRASDGRFCLNLTVVLPTGVVASPAFADDTLYVVDTDGVLHALTAEVGCKVDRDSTTSSDLTERWNYASDAPVSSSPAAASAPDGTTVVVFGADDGTVHAVVDHGDSGDALWTVATAEHGTFGRSSPAINSDGTVFVTTTAGRLYAIGG